MELLQYHRYQADKISVSYLHEVKTQIESIIEVCQEGEVSVHEAYNIVEEELFCIMDYHSEIWQNLDRLEDDLENDYTLTPDGSKLLGFRASYYDSIKKDLELILNKLKDYRSFLDDTLDKLCEILVSADYYKNRKAKLKMQIISDGLLLSPEKADETHKPKLDMADRQIEQLAIFFPKIRDDCQLLFEKEFFIKTTKGIRRGQKISKRFITDYFKDIKPSDKKEVQWSVIESIFNEQDLKNSASYNGKKYKEGSGDFLRWLEIKKNINDK
jgi:hypothetical protein